jgi:HSP20 family protein
MSLIRWNPFGELDDILSRFPRGLVARPADFAFDGADWRPAANVAETDKEYTIRVDLPEVKKDDIDVSVENGVLTISGERRYEKASDDEREHRRETFHGSFQRSFALPEGVDVDGINADSKDGVLIVRLPKQVVRKPEPVKIRVQ